MTLAARFFACRVAEMVRVKGMWSAELRGVAVFACACAAFTCFVDPGPVGGDSEGMNPTSSTSAATAETTTSTATSTSAGVSSSGEPGCDGDDACPIDEVCIDGLCQAAACEPFVRVKDYEEPAVMLLIDKSRSMVNNTWDHDGIIDTLAETRWKTLHRTLIEVAGLAEGSFDFGLKLFPDIGVPNAYESAACAVSGAPDIVLMEGVSVLLADTLPNSNATAMDGDIAGGTPAALAIEVGVNHLMALGESERSHFILMVTDGGANCRTDAESTAELFESYDMSVLDAAKDAVASGVEVAIVGLEISSIENTTQADGKPDKIVPSQVISALAEAGGMPPNDGAVFPNAVDESSLFDGLNAHLRVMSCTVTAAPPKGGAQLKGLRVDGQQFQALTAEKCIGGDGFADLGGGRLRLCGVACSLYLTSLSVELNYVCN